MKQWNNVRGGNDQKWQSNVMMLERTLYEQNALLIRIVGGVFTAGQHWCKSKNNKSFPMYCPTFNAHTEDHDLMLCHECWMEFESGQRVRPYHSKTFNVYSPEGNLLDDPTKWAPRPPNDSCVCPIHNTPLQNISCGLCDMRKDGFDGRVGPPSRRYIFNVLVREFQNQGHENPLRVMEIAGQTMEQINKLQLFNKAHPADPDMGCDFFINYEKNTRTWTMQMEAPNKPLTPEERILPLWEVDYHFRAAELTQIAEATSTHNLRQVATAEQIAEKNAWRAQNGLPPLQTSAPGGQIATPTMAAPAMTAAPPATMAPATTMAVPPMTTSVPQATMNVAPMATLAPPATRVAPPAATASPSMTTAVPPAMRTAPPQAEIAQETTPATVTTPTPVVTPAAVAPAAVAPVAVAPVAVAPAAVAPVAVAPVAVAPVAVVAPAAAPATMLTPAAVAPVAEALVEVAPSGDAPIKECFGQWGSNTECMRCKLRMGCIEKYQQGGGQ